jgi:hypothetical protein
MDEEKNIQSTFELVAELVQILSLAEDDHAGKMV